MAPHFPEDPFADRGDDQRSLDEVLDDIEHSASVPDVSEIDSETLGRMFRDLRTLSMMEENEQFGDGSD